MPLARRDTLQEGALVQLLREVTVPMAELWFAASGLLMIVFGVPLILRRVPPNAFYGLRVPATFKDEQVWYDANGNGLQDLNEPGIGGVTVSRPLSVDARSRRGRPNVQRSCR